MTNIKAQLRSFSGIFFQGLQWSPFSYMLKSLASKYLTDHTQINFFKGLLDKDSHASKLLRKCYQKKLLREWRKCVREREDTNVGCSVNQKHSS